MVKTKVKTLDKVKVNNKKCSKCDQIYKTVADQKRHEKAPKTGILLICQICFFKSCTEEGLEIHNDLTHKTSNSNLPLRRRGGGAVEDKNVLVPSSIIIKPRIIQKIKLQDNAKQKDAEQKPEIIRTNLKKNIKSEKATAAAKKSDVILNCNFCEHVFNSEIALKIHQSLAHDKSEENVLKRPKTSVINVTTEVVPQNVNKFVRNHECGFCEQTFESLRYLQIHLNICNNPKVNKYGPKSQHGKRKREDSRQSIPPIVTAETNQPIESKNQFKCEICDRIFNKMMQLNMHKKVVHGKTPRIDKVKTEESKQTAAPSTAAVNSEKYKHTSANVEANLKAVAEMSEKSKQTAAKSQVHLEAVVAIKSEKYKQTAAKVSQAYPKAVGGQRPDFQRKTSEDSKTTLNVLPPSETTECEICLKTFCNKNYLQKHKEIVHNPRKAQHQVKSCKCKKKCSHNPQNLIITQEDASVNSRPSANPKNTTFEKNASHKPTTSPDKVFTPANQCHICDKTFANPYNVKLHIKVDHEQSEVFKCSMCEQSFKFQNQLQMHISSVHPTQSKSYTCEVSLCGKTYAQNSHLELHMKMDHPKPSGAGGGEIINNVQFKCKYCEKAFDQKKALSIHVTKSHKFRPNGENNLNNLFECKHCDKVFGEEKALNAHVARSHENTYAFKCDSCALAFKLKPELELHRKISHKNNVPTHPFKCDSCVLAFKLKTELELHKMIHHEKSNFKCKYCHYTCVKNEDFRNHLKSHIIKSSNSKQQQKIVKENSQKNVIIPSSEETQKVKPIKEDTSKTDKNTRKNPETTGKMIKKESPDIIIDEIKPKCGFCFKEFSSFASLKVHVKNIHEGGNNKNYKCKFCEKVFGQSGRLKDHIVNVHQLQITGYKCEYDGCEKSFSKTEDLKIHKKHAHIFKVYDGPKHINEGNPIMKPSEKESIKCEVCHKTFNEPLLLKMHMTTFHSFKCRFCPQAFHDAKTLKNHIYQIHQITDKNADFAGLRQQGREWHNHTGTMHDDSVMKSRNSKNKLMNNENEENDLKILDIFSLNKDTRTVNDKENTNQRRKAKTKNHLKIKAFTSVKEFQEKVLLKFKKKDNEQFISQQMIEGVNIPGVNQPVQMDSSILPTYWTKWVDRPGIEAKWAIYFQNPKGTKFTSKAQINKYIEKYHLSYSSDIFDFELDVNVNKLQKIWKRFFFKKSSSDSSSGDDSSNNTDVDIMATVDNYSDMDEKNDEGNEIPTKKKIIAPLYSEASWLNRIKIPNNKHKMATRKRQRSGSFLAENSENELSSVSKFSKLDDEKADKSEEISPGSIISREIVNDLVLNFETSQDRNTMCRIILDNVITNFETSEDICEGILSNVIENIESKEQTRMLNNIKENFNRLRNEGKEKKKSNFDYFEIIGSSRSNEMKCEDIFGPIKITTMAPIKSDKIEFSKENVDLKTTKQLLNQYANKELTSGQTKIASVDRKSVMAPVKINSEMKCEDIFGLKEDRQRKIKIEGEKICKTIFNDVISNLETKEDRKNISKGILDSLVDNFETSDDRQFMCTEIVKSLIPNFDTSDEKQIICDKNLNSNVENHELKKPVAIEEKNPSLEFGSSIFTEKYLEMKKNENISPGMDVISNENIKVPDSDGELISRNILNTVVENLDIGEIISEEIMNDLVANLELKIEQQPTGGMDIFSRLLGF